MEKLHIRELREAVGLSQTDLAKSLGVDRSMVSLWESGKKVPKASRLPKLSVLLQCSIDELFTGRRAAS